MLYSVFTVVCSVFTVVCSVFTVVCSVNSGEAFMYNINYNRADILYTHLQRTQGNGINKIMSASNIVEEE